MPNPGRTAAIAFVLAGLGEPALAQEVDPRERRGHEVVAQLSAGKGQPILDELRRDFPPLGDAVLNFALGEIVGRQVLDPRTRQIATVAMLAAEGHLPQMRVHAGYALDQGLPPAELVEIVYLTSVYAGFPRAINAAAGLRELLTERGIELPVSD